MGCSISGPGQSGAPSERSLRMESAPSPPIDMERFRELAGGNEQSMRDLAALYLRQTGEQLKQLHHAFEAGNPAEVRRVAHSCAGASATCGMGLIAEPLRELESMGTRDDLSGIEKLLARVREEFESIQDYFTQQNLHPPS